MPVSPGSAWGEPGPLADDGILVGGDTDASDAVTQARHERRPVPELGLLGGDLARTCGATGDVDRLRGPDAHRLPIDLGEVLVDGELRFFVAHLVARRSWLRGPILAVMNAQYLGRWDVAPRAHPGDGKLDVVEAHLGLGDRWKAWRRLPTGTHVPHPGIRTRRTTGFQTDLEPGTKVWLDGRPMGPARTLSIRVAADALVGVV